ncbi:MAG: Arm DNA-binding domain-containing protein, partial [Bacteroidaceae bacterium]|nr:Arm DNA-binding domain-containing protein [Bacteroidaceae bacterium]
MFSTRIVFDRRGQAQKDKNNEGSLEVRVTVDRKSYYINTGMRIRAKHWAGAIVARPDADALNNRLGIIVRRVNEEINKFIEERRPIDVAIVRERCFEG